MEKIFRSEGRATDGGAISVLAWFVVWWHLPTFPLEMALMSVLVYARAAQFGIISLIAAHSSILNMALTVCV